MKKILLLFMLAILTMGSASADELSVTWAMGTSTTAVAVPATAADNMSYSVGAGLTESGTRSVNDVTFLELIQNTGSTWGDNRHDSALDLGKYVDFTFTPVDGAFVPTNISFDIVKFGTSAPNVFVDVVDGEGNTIAVADNEYIIRNNDVSSTAHSYTVSGAVSSENAVTLRILVGKLATNKSVGIANVVISGTYLKKQTLDFNAIPTRIYGSTYSLPTTTNEGLPLTWKVDDNTIASISNGELTAQKAGTATVTATQAGNSSYMSFSKEYALTVNKAMLTVTANDAAKVYGEAIPALTFSYSGFVNGDDASVLTAKPTVTTTATQSSAVGTYPITASGAAADNYEIDYMAGTLTVTKASQNVALSSIPAQTYGAAAYTLPTSTSQGLSLTWTVANTAIATVSGNTLTIKKAGSTKVTATQAGGANYSAFSKEFTLTVNKASLTITANDATKTYGAANPTLTAAYSGFVNGDDATKLTTLPTITTDATASSAVGTYTIMPSGAASDNYTFTYKAGTLTVTKASLTITADDKTKDVGDENPELTVSYSGFVNGDDATTLTTQPTVTTTATAESPEGTYPITVSGAASENYDVSYVSGTMTVVNVFAKNNVIACNDIAVRYGQKVALPVMMTNDADLNLVGISFTLTLPQGVTVDVDEDGSPVFELTSSRLSPKQFSVYTNQYADGSWGFRIITNNATAKLNGTEGEMMNITLKVADNVEPGVYDIQLTENKLSLRTEDNNVITKTINDVTSSIEVLDVEMGDVNGDGTVDLSDAIMVTYYSLHIAPASFIEAAADMNGDGDIDLSDAIIIIYKSLGVVQ